jgi:Rieske 2Fe-2S family protein
LNAAPPSVGGNAKTWTLDGELAFPVMPGLGDDDVARGVAFACFTASLFVIAHPDYARSVRIRPTGPEAVELTIDWLLPAGVDADDEAALEAILGLARRVIAQDAAVCELNQRGLHSRRHAAGVLMPQEYDLWHFHESLREKLAAFAGR